MTATRWRDLVGPFVIAAAVGFVVLRVIGAISGTVPNVPRSAVITVLILALVLGVTTLVVRPRLLRRPGREPMQPLTAGRVVALAFASSRAGAVIAGFFLGWVAAGWLVDAWNTPFARERVINGAVAVIGGAAIAAIGVVLERACRVPPAKDDAGDGSA
jgi:hypothetical protein